MTVVVSYIQMWQTWSSCCYKRTGVEGGGGGEGVSSMRKVFPE